MTELPNPGSEEAIEDGCTCPVIDNRHGKGCYFGDGIFIYNGACPVHGPMFRFVKPKQEEVEDDE